MKFDTRMIKPKVWNILVLTVVMVLIQIFLSVRSGGEGIALASALVLDVYYILVIVFLAAGFYKQLQYNPYSYNTIYYMGFALLTAFVLVTHVVLTVAIARYPEIYQQEQILHLLYGSAKNYMYLTFPFLFIFSVALCVSNLSLIRHEGKRLVNILGIILSFLLVAGVLFLFLVDRYATGSQFEVMMHDLGTNLYAAVYLYFECMLIGAIVADVIAARYEPERDKDFLIILGCGIQKDGRPTPLLRGRIDRALDFARRQKEETGKDLIFVASGGQGPNEVISEGASMKQYLLEQGYPRERAEHVIFTKSLDYLERTAPADTPLYRRAEELVTTLSVDPDKLSAHARNCLKLWNMSHALLNTVYRLRHAKGKEAQE